MQIYPDAASEAQFNILFSEDCRRKEELLIEFEKLEERERRRKNPTKRMAKRKYERVTKGIFLVVKKNKDLIHLADDKGKKLGVLQVNPKIGELLRINDDLEGVLGFRDGFWRAQFIFCIGNSTEDFLPQPETPKSI